MRILQIAHIFLPHIGGLEMYAYRLARDVVASGEKCEVLASAPGVKAGRKKISGIPINYLKSVTIFPRNPWFFGVGRYLNHFRPDIVHLHSIWFFLSWQVCRYKKRYGFKIINTVHGVAPDYANWMVKIFLIIFRPLAKVVIAKSDKIIVLSNWEREKLIRYFNVDKDKIVVIPSAIEKVKPIVNYQTRYKIDNPYLLFVSRMIPDKNPDILIKALRRLNKKYPNLAVVFVGDLETNYRDSLLALAGDLANRVIFYGSLDPIDETPKLAWLYKHALMSVAIGSWEGLPVRVMESMAQGTPVVCYTSGGLRDLIKNKYNGYLIEKLDDRLLAAKIDSYLSLGKEAKTTVSKNAKESVRSYLWANVFKRIMRLYKDIK